MRVCSVVVRPDPGRGRPGLRGVHTGHDGNLNSPYACGRTKLRRYAASTVDWLVAFLPAAFRVDARERWRAVVGSALGILVTASISHWVGGQLGIVPWLAAPLGASAVLVFTVPASPLAQPWAVIGGNTISAFVGLACAAAIGDTASAASVAVAAAIAVMFLLRCLHPPGGATALLAVLSHASDPRFALLPILLNSALLVLVAMLYNTVTGRRYPHLQAPPAAPATQAASRFTAADLDAALTHYNQVLDVSRDDLEELLHYAETAAFRRNLGALRCGDIMSHKPVAVTRETSTAEVGALMRSREIKALPVVDGADRIVGIVTRADLLGGPEGAGAPPRRVGQIMTRSVRVAGVNSRVIELLQLFSEGGHHHIPIVDDDEHLVGIITQSDLVRALHRAVLPN
jgi:CBS domain-containing membrane protein